MIVHAKNHKASPGWGRSRISIGAAAATLAIWFSCAALAMLLVPGALLAQTNVTTTVAGQGVAGVSLSLPTGVAADAAGNFYVADTNNCVIWKISNGVSSVFAGTKGNCSPGGGSNPTLAYPVDVAACNGNLYIATHGVDPSLTRFAGATAAGGSIYMVDSSRNIFTLPTPSVPPSANSPPFPVALACDVSGNVFVSSYFYSSSGLSGTVDEIPVGNSSSQNLLVQTGTAFPGIAVDGNDDVFVLEAPAAAGWLGTALLGSGNLWELPSGGGSTTVNTSGQLQNPARLALDASGNFYITQATAASNPTVLVTTVPAGGGSQTMFAGNGTAGYSGDGLIPTHAELNNATGLAFDGCGSLYIADAGNNAVRKALNSSTASNAGCTSGSSGTGSARGATTTISLTASAIQVTAPQTISFYSNVSVGNCPTCTTPLQGEVDFCYAAAPTANPCGPGGVIFGTVLVNGPLNTEAIANLFDYPFPIPGTYSVAVEYGNNQGNPPTSTSAPLTVTVCGANCTDPGIPNIPQSNYPVELTPGVLSTAFSGLGAVAFDGSKNRYFLNNTAGTVTRLDAGGGSTVLIPSAALPASLNNPSDMVVGSDGNLYITDTGNNRVVKVVGPATASPTVSVITPTPALAQGLSSPTGIFETSSEVYVSDTGNNRVVVFRPDGTVPSVIFSSATKGAPAIGLLQGIVVNPSTLKIYIANAPASGSTSPGNIIVTSIGGSASLLSTPLVTLQSPFGLALDPANGLYFSDTGTHQIYRMDVSGNILVVAGNGTTTPQGEGVSATQTGLESPSWLALDLSNSIWFTDAGTLPPSVREVDVTEALADFTAANQSQTIYLTSPVSAVQGSVGFQLPASPYLMGLGSADFSVNSGTDSPASTCFNTFGPSPTLSPNTSCTLVVTLNTASLGATAEIDFLSQIELSLGSFNSSTALTQVIKLNGAPSAGRTTLTITAPALVLGTFGQAYGPAQFLATGGSGQVTFTVSTGLLPSGLSLSATGSLSGPPSQAGTFSFTVSASDTNGDTGNQAFSLTINPTISVMPSGTTINAGATQQFTATLVGTISTMVTWSVQAGGAGGTIDPNSGLYTAPAAGGTDVVVATSVAFPGAMASAMVTVTPPVTITITPLTTSLPAGVQQQFTASVTGTTNTAVTWSVATGGAGGTISTTGLYTAPATGGMDTVIATSVANPVKSAQATVTVTVSVLPASPTIASVTPSSGFQGQQGLSVAITGNNFVAGSTSVTIGGGSVGISVQSFAVNSATSATAVLNIDPATALGSYDVVVSVTGAPMTATLTSGFTVTTGTIPINVTENIKVMDTPLVAAPYTVTGIVAPVVNYSAGSIGFVGLSGGQTATQTLTVSNVGLQPLTISTATITQDATNSFSISQVQCSDGTSSITETIQSGAECTLTISYTQPASGTPSGLITFTDTAALSNLTTTGSSPNFMQIVGLSSTSATTAPPAEPPNTIPISITEPITVMDAPFVAPPYTVTGIAAPVANYSAGSLGFVGIPAGQTVTQTLTISNVGLQPLAISAETIMQDASTSFSVTQVLCSDGTTSITETIASGGECTLTISYTAPVSGTPSGTITFTDNAGLSNLTSTASGANFTQTLALSTTASTTAAPAEPPTTISISINEPITVNDTPTVMAESRATTTTLTSSANPAVFYQPLQYVVNVTAAYGNATGTVTFYLAGNPIGTSPLMNGTAALTFSYSVLGSFSITATYSGDATHDTSTSPVLVQSVNKATPMISVSSSVTPQLIGQPITFTASVVGPFGGPVSGNVVFFSGTTQLGSAVLSNGQMTFQHTFTTAGTRSITVQYTGDTYNTGGTSPAISQSVVAAFKTTTTLTSSVNPSYIGQNVTFTATASTTSPPGISPPDGEIITFTVGGASPLTTDAAMLGGKAHFSIATLPVGATTVTASYGGDARLKASTSAALRETVSKYPTSTTLTSSLNPSIYGQSVTLMAVVNSTGPTAPTNLVTFKNGTTPLSAPVSLTNGVATLAITNLPAGTLSITATYSGDADSAASTSASLSQVVSMATTSTAVVSSPNPSTLGKSVKLTATVSSSTTTPTGTVTFSYGTTVLDTVKLAGGQAILKTTTLPHGSITITATYNGNGTGNIAGSFGTHMQTVN